MFCAHCGTQFSDQDAFCPNCGTAVLNSPALQRHLDAQEPIYAPAEETQVLRSEPPAAPVAAEPPVQLRAANPPARQLATGRGLLKYIFLGLITLGIYNLVVFCRISGEINLVAQRDGRKTIHYLAMKMLSTLTFGIVPLVWWHHICNRMGNELSRRGVGYSFGARHYWLLNILGAITIVCPLIFTYKFFKAANKLNADYNIYG